MNTITALAIGFAGSLLCIALAILLFGERSPFADRPGWEFAGLLGCLALNVSGWIVALLAVSP